MSWSHFPLQAKTNKTEQSPPSWPSDFRTLMLYVINSANSCFSQFCTACGGYSPKIRLGNCNAILSRQVPSSYSKNRCSIFFQVHSKYSKGAEGHARHVLWCYASGLRLCWLKEDLMGDGDQGLMSRRKKNIQETQDYSTPHLSLPPNTKTPPLPEQ